MLSPEPSPNGPHLDPGAPASQTEKIYFCCLSRSIRDSLLWLPEQTKTPPPCLGGLGGHPLLPLWRGVSTPAPQEQRAAGTRLASETKGAGSEARLLHSLASLFSLLEPQSSLLPNGSTAPQPPGAFRGAPNAWETLSKGRRPSASCGRSSPSPPERPRGGAGIGLGDHPSSQGLSCDQLLLWNGGKAVMKFARFGGKSKNCPEESYQGAGQTLPVSPCF